MSSLNDVIVLSQLEKDRPTYHVLLFAVKLLSISSVLLFFKCTPQFHVTQMLLHKSSLI